MTVTITRFSYGTSVPLTASIDPAPSSFDVASSIQGCYYSAPEVVITITEFSNFLTKVTPINLVSGSAVTKMGDVLIRNINISNLIAFINTKSQLDKRWTSTSTISDSFWINFFNAVGDIDLDFTNTPPKTGDLIQFVFKFDARITGDLNGIVPSDITLPSGDKRFLVGQTFRFA